jgi:hypothetical protein
MCPHVNIGSRGCNGSNKSRYHSGVKGVGFGDNIEVGLNIVGAPRRPIFDIWGRESQLTKYISFYLDFSSIGTTGEVYLKSVRAASPRVKMCTIFGKELVIRISCCTRGFRSVVLRLNVLLGALIHEISRKPGKLIEAVA